MNASRQPGVCRECGRAVIPSDKQCPSCHTPNPDHVFDPDAGAIVPAPVHPPEVRIVPASPAPSPSPAAEPAPSAAPTFQRSAVDLSFDDLLVRLARDEQDGCKVIANIGFSESGKTWLVARMGKQRGGLMNTWLYSMRKPSEQKIIRTGDQLARTPLHESYVWHLGATKRLLAARSGNWRVIDIAGEQVSDLHFAMKLAQGSRIHDVLLMTIAHASALVLVIDGRPIAQRLGEFSSPAEAARACHAVDEVNELILNELLRLVRFVYAWCNEHGKPGKPEDLAGLREAIRLNPEMSLGTVGEPLDLPTQLLISKADSLVTLPTGRPGLFPAPGPDAARFAATFLPNTYRVALNNLAVFRWGFAAPFVGQPSKVAGAVPDLSEVIDFSRRSFGVDTILAWLDAELSTPRAGNGLMAQQALSRFRRWLPLLPWRRA
jgi:hypothetical protein